MVISYLHNTQEKLGPFGSIIEKDPTINLLEKKLKEKFLEIIPKEPEPIINPRTTIKEVSFEDILREMLAEKNAK